MGDHENMAAVKCARLDTNVSILSAATTTLSCKLLSLSSSLLAELFSLLNEHEHCRLGSLCKQLHYVSWLGHSWHSILIGSAYRLRDWQCCSRLQERGSNAALPRMCVKQIGLKFCGFPEPTDPPCEFCASLTKFFGSLANARPVVLKLHCSHADEFNNLPKTERLKKLSIARVTEAAAPWLASCLALTELSIQQKGLTQWCPEKRDKTEYNLALTALRANPSSRLSSLQLDYELDAADVQQLAQSGLPITALSLCLKESAAIEQLLPLRLRSLTLEMDMSHRLKPKQLPLFAKWPLEALHLRVCLEGTVHDMVLNFPRLTALSMWTSQSLKFIRAPLLESLTLPQIWPDDISTLASFANLTSFIHGWYCSEPDQLLNALQSLPRLKRLSISELRHFDELHRFPNLQEVEIHCAEVNFEVLADKIAALAARGVKIPFLFVQNGTEGKGVSETLLSKFAHLNIGLKRLCIGEWANVSRRFLFKRFGRIQLSLIHENCAKSDLEITGFECPLYASMTLSKESGWPSEEERRAQWHTTNQQPKAEPCES